MTDLLFMSYYPLFFLLPVAYIIGSIPFGVIISRGKGIDLTKSGSKNIGATNVLRTSGKVPALLTLAGDSLKGAVAVLLCRYVIANFAIAESSGTFVYNSEVWEGLVGLTVVLGHIYSVFMSFRGGKGVATSFGVLAVYSPLEALMVLLVWVLTVVALRYSSLAAICSFISLPLIYFFIGASDIMIYFGIILCVLILLRHRPNIHKLIIRTEPRIGDSVK